MVKDKLLSEFLLKDIVPLLDGKWRVFDRSSAVQIYRDFMVGFCFRITGIDRVSIMFFIKALSIPIDVTVGTDITISQKIMIPLEGWLNKLMNNKKLYQFRWDERNDEVERITSLIKLNDKFPIGNRLNYQSLLGFISEAFPEAKHPHVLRTKGLLAAHLGNGDLALRLLNEAKSIHEQAVIEFTTPNGSQERSLLEKKRAEGTQIEIESVRLGTFETHCDTISKSSKKKFVSQFIPKL